MSKLRQQARSFPEALETPLEGDLAPYLVLTQLREGAEHISAGWLDAADDEMAMQFAREHYGQDQACVNIWAIPRDAIAGTEPEFPPSGAPGPTRSYRVFTRSIAGDQYVARDSVEADCGAAALDAARAAAPDADAILVAPIDRIVSTAEGDVIWRYTDQSYRLARGYSKDVRRKWEQIRAERDLVEYEKEDLKESF